MSTYQAVNACCWRSSGWIPGTTGDIRQGVYSSYGQCVGAMVFDNASIRSTYASYYPTSASLALYRTGSGSWGSAVIMTLYAGNQSSMPSVSGSSTVTAPRPSKVTSGYDYTISAGQGAKSISISTALIDSLGSGASNCLFIDAGSSTSRYMSFKGRNDLTQVVLTINWASRTSSCSAPTTFKTAATIVETTTTLSWSGASAGTNNAISSYEIQYSDSSDGSTWGSWTALQTVSSSATSGSLTVSPPTTRGYYRRYRIRTRGTAGSSYYSGWATSSNTVRKNTLPTAPTTVTASPVEYSSPSATLVWSGATAGTSAISYYLLQTATSTDGLTWSAYSTIGSYTSRTAVVAPPSIPGIYSRYRVCTVDTLSASSGYCYSNVIRMVVPPTVPVFAAPTANALTYSSAPRVLVTVPIAMAGQRVSLSFRVGTGTWYNSINHTAYFSVSGYYTTQTNVIIRLPSQTVGLTSVSIKTADPDTQQESTVSTRAFSVTAAPYAQDDITAGSAMVKAEHILHIREAMDALVGYYGITQSPWSQTLTQGKTPILYWSTHIREIRNAYLRIADFINDFDPGGVFGVPEAEWLNIGTGRPRTDVTTQLHNLLTTL